jgi:hypothetical protein
MGAGMVMDTINFNECSTTEIFSVKSRAPQLGTPPTLLHHSMDMEAILFWGYMILSVAIALIFA